MQMSEHARRGCVREPKALFWDFGTVYSCR